MPDESTAARFWAKVEFTEACWIWTASVQGGGYGAFSVGSRSDGSRQMVRAHRWAYEFCIGPIPAGLTIDHLCRVRLCVRPDHLEPVPQRVNVRRGQSAAGNRARQTHCDRGHLLAGENLVAWESRRGKRMCRECVRYRRQLRSKGA